MLDKQLGARGISKLDPGKEKEYMDALQQHKARSSADRNRKIAFLCPNRTVADRIAEPLAQLRRVA